jgi:hypothetical protein
VVLEGQFGVNFEIMPSHTHLSSLLCGVARFFSLSEPCMVRTTADFAAHQFCVFKVCSSRRQPWWPHPTPAWRHCIGKSGRKGKGLGAFRSLPGPEFPIGLQPVLPRDWDLRPRQNEHLVGSSVGASFPHGSWISIRLRHCCGIAVVVGSKDCCLKAT